MLKAHAGEEYTREAPETYDPDRVSPTVVLENVVGKLFYNVQCPLCDAKNQSLSWLIALQGDANTQGGMLKGTPPSGSAGEVYEGVQVVVQDEEHPRIILSNFTLAVTQPPLSVSVGSWVAIALAIVLVPLLTVLSVQKIRQYIKDNTTLDFAEALEHLKREGTVHQHDIEKEMLTPDELKRSHVRLLEVLGQGAFGEVRKALYTGAKAPYTVAVKTCVKRDGEEELVSEMALMAQFQHDHVLSLVGVVTAGKPILLVMQHCEYGSLKDYLMKHDGFLALTSEAQLKMCLEVCLGMEYLASNKFVHRDLAARNVLIASDYECQVADFGLSRHLGDEGGEYYRMKGAGLIPCRWAAPEALTEGKFSSASDVWSYGVLLYEIFTGGERPFGDMSNNEVIAALRAGLRLEQPPACPASIYLTVMEPCWAELPNDRPLFSTIVNIVREAYNEHVSTAQIQRSMRRMSNARESLRGSTAFPRPSEPIMPGYTALPTVHTRNGGRNAAPLGSLLGPERVPGGSPLSGRKHSPIVPAPKVPIEQNGADDSDANQFYSDVATQVAVQGSPNRADARTGKEEEDDGAPATTVGPGMVSNVDNISQGAATVEGQVPVWPLGNVSGDGGGDGIGGAAGAPPVWPLGDGNVAGAEVQPPVWPISNNANGGGATPLSWLETDLASELNVAPIAAGNGGGGGISTGAAVGSAVAAESSIVTVGVTTPANVPPTWPDLGVRSTADTIPTQIPAEEPAGEGPSLPSEVPAAAPAASTTMASTHVTGEYVDLATAATVPQPGADVSAASAAAVEPSPDYVTTVPTGLAKPAADAANAD